MEFSVIIPIYNRPDELRELLESLCEQTKHNFEVIVVDDGSDQRSDEIVHAFEDELDISYYWKENEGPGQTRNYGAARSNKPYLIFFDSDCVIPEHYMEKTTEYITSHQVDAYGGPDAARSSFTALQKAINYSMTSFLTTGGIRGGKKKVDTYYPRTFNMGVSKNAFGMIGGFADMRYGEDVDFSMRLHENNFSTTLIEEAYVYHKRRTDIISFYKQVFHFGRARYNLSHRHPGSLKPIHLLPSAFALYVWGAVLLAPAQPLLLLPLFLALFIFFADALRVTRTFPVALLSSVTSFIQIFGYGMGLIWETLRPDSTKKSS